MADRLLELGDIELFARELGVSIGTARRMVRRGPPPRWSDARLLAYASALFRLSHERDVAREKTARELLEKRRRAPVYSLSARVAAVATLERVLSELDRRRPCEKGTWTPRSGLASELGVSSVRLGRWLASGRVPAEFMERFDSWAQARVEHELRRLREQGHVEALIQQAKTPQYAHTLPGAPRKFSAKAPDLKTQEGRTESEEQSGYQWVLRVEQWSTFELIERWCAWAASRRRPAGMRSSRLWIVTALCSIYHPRGRRPGGRKSPGGIRQFERQSDRERGNNLSLGVPVSSRLVRRGGLERAVRLFRENMILEHCEQEQIYVHGLIVRNWRNRSKIERRNYRRRVSARLRNEQALADLAKEARRADKRESARIQALERRGSAAGRRTPAGARSRRKKRP